MRKHMRRMIPLGLVSLTAGLVAIMLTGTVGLAATQAPPTNTQPPTIGGTPEVGKTLTAREGTWTGNPTDYDYAWRRCDAGRRQLLAHQRRGRAHVRAQDRRPGQHAPRRRHRAERRRAPQRDLRPDRGHP